MSNKNKHTIWLPDSTWQKVEDYYRTDNCAAKNEFIKKAIEFYVGSLHTKNANAFLPEVLSTTLTGTLDGFASRISSLLFKQGVDINLMAQIIAYDTDIDEGTYERLRGRAIRDMKRTNGRISFKDAMDFQKSVYSDLVEAAQNAMREMISRMQHQICDSPIIEDNMRQLVQALETTTGKKQYGYLNKPLKQLVDTIGDALAELPEVSECYEVWNQIHEELNECYGHSTPWERLPLSQRKEFRKIKNDIIREAENIRLGLPTFEDERMQDEPEPESQKEEHQSYSVYEQAQRYLQITKGYVRVKMECKDYILAQKTAIDALRFDPKDSELNMYAILTMGFQGNLSMAQTYYTAAKPYLALEHAEVIKKYLNIK